MTEMTQATVRAPDKGHVIVSTAAGLIILLLVVLWAGDRWMDYVQRKEWQVSAVQVTRFVQAVRAYTGRYYDTLLKSTTTTTPLTVTVDMLKNTGFLEPGFSGTISGGQQLQAALVRNTTNTEQLQGLVVSQGGTALPYMAVRDISVNISAGLGAYVWDSATVITGAMGAWEAPMASYGITTTGGHIGALLTTDELNAAREDNDRLYRFAVTGKPDLNRMHTSIDMGGNDLNNTGTVNAKTGKFTGDVAAGGKVDAGGNMTAGGGVTANGDIRSNNGSLVTRGNNGWRNETFQGGFYMSDYDWVRAIGNKGIYTGGQVRGGTVKSDGRLTVGEYSLHTKIEVAGTSCPQNGLQASDASGGALFCQSGVWKSFQNKFSIQAFDVGKNVTNRDIGIHAYCSWTNLNGSPFGGFQKVYADRSNRWFVTNTRWGDYESGGTITVTCLNLPGAGI
ncbi:shufflon system plasmid conjugative transfer pilus tip adhesin PilV [Salmonella enterica subsp. enterica serovar Agona]|nr:shufflon system plasmid conjugative transfer pilus tip adhesin PilV [Salmonella enterica]MDQ7484402.1 shufflon system plasmid conjugative transfer pilus tip adhesin PilV [Salmonella enterica subsp. enterica serovar Agona]